MGRTRRPEDRWRDLERPETKANDSSSTRVFLWLLPDNVDFPDSPQGVATDDPPTFRQPAFRLCHADVPLQHVSLRRHQKVSSSETGQEGRRCRQSRGDPPRRIRREEENVGDGRLCQKGRVVR